MLRCTRLPRDLVVIGRRSYATAQSQVQTVKVACQSNGHITLNICYPTPSSPADSRPPAVLIYLPPGPSLYEAYREPTILSQLQSQRFPFPIVQLNYRIGREHPYPGPIHDVLQGYDWIKENLLPKPAVQRVGRPNRRGKIAVCGELVGGGLAAMLALTECRVGQPGIVAAALSNPVVDWVALENGVPSTEHSPTASPTEQMSAQQLSSLRSKLFRKPEHYFDPFASPMLFLRSPGRDVPPAAAPDAQLLDDMEQLSLLNRAQLLGSRTGETQTAESVPLKMTAKRYPSPSLSLRLPSFRVHAGRTSPLLGQAEEFAKRVRQAHVRQAGEADFGRKVLTEDELDRLEDADRHELAQRGLEAREKAGFAVHEGTGGWDETEGGRARVAEMGRWVRGVLG